MKRQKNYSTSFFLSLMFVVLVTTQNHAQKMWTLTDCLDYATEHNLRIEAAQVTKSNGKLQRQEAHQARYPDLSAGTGFSYNFGRNIDPTTNDFVPQNAGFNWLNLSTNILVYNGGLLRQQYQQALLTEKANDASIEQEIQDVHLEITLAYLTILFETERRRNSVEQRSLAQNQLDRVQQLIQVEQAPEADQYEWIAQVAQGEQQILANENAIEVATYQLRNLLNIDPEDDFQMDVSAIDAEDVQEQEDYSFAETYASILRVRPEVASFELTEQAAEKGIAIARASYLPSLSFGAELSTSYSTLANTFDDFGVRRVPTEGVFINNEAVIYEREQLVPDKSFRTPYGTQLEQNLGVGLGVRLNIPIYSRGLKKINMQRAENNLLLARNANQQSLKGLELQTQQVLADLRTAHRQYTAGLRQVEFLQNAYDNMEKRYELGMSNSYDLLDAQNRLSQGNNQLTIAKYDLLFRNKILDFYLGEELSGDF